VRRREFIILGGSSLVGLTASAQQPSKVARIGFLATELTPVTRAPFDAFREGLRERGYVEGQNIVIELRLADGKIDRFPSLAAELVRLEVDLIVAPNTPAARAAQQATTTIPIVAPAMGDPVKDGLVASLARPGGNITGLTFLGPELVPKRLALLKEALPNVSRVAALWHPGAFGERAMTDMLREIEAAARALGVHLQLVEVREPDELDRAFSTMTSERTDAVFVFPSSMLYGERRRIGELATKHHLPTMSGAREFVELGGLIAYGASITDLLRRGASHVDKILKGAKPADLPVEQPTKFELVISLKTAKALGITIPPTLLASADEVIE